MLLPALKREEVVLLDVDDEGNVVAHHPEVSPMLLTGSELYRDFFGIDDVYPRNLAKDYRRYAFLVGNPRRTDDEEREMKALAKKLADLGIDPGWEPVARDAT